jgi:hypothetical protein
VRCGPDLGSIFATGLQPSKIGLSRDFACRSIISSVCIVHEIGPASLQISHGTQMSATSVPPICTAFRKCTRRISGFWSASKIGTSHGESRTLNGPGVA